MISWTKVNQHPHPLHLSPTKPPKLSNPISSISLKPLSKPKQILSTSSISTFSPIPQNQPPKPASQCQPLNPLSSLLKTTCITIFTTSLIFNHFTKPSIASPPPVPTVEELKQEEEDKANEKFLEEYLVSNPNDIEAIRTLMEVKIQDQKLLEAISLVERLIKIEPLDTQWVLLKAHLHNYSGEVELAKSMFEDILSKNPLFVEGYHGLVMTISPTEEGELGGLVKRIETAMEQCEKEKRKEDFRDFKLLLAQIRFIQGSYEEALKVYQELAEEEPRDFRPYLYQGIIYTMLRKSVEAKKQFDNYRRFVPKDHPYARHFADNVMATDAFAQILESGKSS